MSRPGVTIQPKPTGNHFVPIHRCYKDITDQKDSTAALLSVLEYLAENTVLRSGNTINVPDSIVIDGDCNYPVLNKILSGMLKPTAIKSKLKYLDDLGFISSTIEGGRRRKIIYHRKAIAEALSKLEYSIDPSKSDQPEIEASKSDGYPSKSDQSNTSDPSKSDDSTRQKVTGTRQKVTPTIYSSRSTTRSKETRSLSRSETPQGESVTIQRTVTQKKSEPTQPTSPVNPKSNQQVGQQIANTSVEDQGSANLPPMKNNGLVSYQSGAAKVEARFRAGQVSRPWRECDARIYQGFREYVRNTLGFKDKTEAQLIDLADSMITKADYSSTGWEFDRINNKWAAFMERCQNASTPAEAVAMTEKQKREIRIAEMEATAKRRYQEAYGGVA